MNDQILKYGLAGVVIIALAGVVKILWIKIDSMERNHKEERDEWRKTINSQFDKANEIVEKNSGILQGLKTLLENRHR